MLSLEQTKTKSSLTAIHSYELSRLELLPLATIIAISSELTAAIQTLRISKQYADETFHRNQAVYYSTLKKLRSNVKIKLTVKFVMLSLQ